MAKREAKGGSLLIPYLTSYMHAGPECIARLQPLNCPLFLFFYEMGFSAGSFCVWSLDTSYVDYRLVIVSD